MDCYLVGDPFSIGNFSMGWMIYNAHDDVVYTLDLGIFDSIEKSAKLSGRRPNKEEREIINQRF